MELRGFLSKNQVLVGVQGAKPPEANGIDTFTQSPIRRPLRSTPRSIAQRPLSAD